MENLGERFEGGLRSLRSSFASKPAAAGQPTGTGSSAEAGAAKKGGGSDSGSDEEEDPMPAATAAAAAAPAAAGRASQGGAGIKWEEAPNPDSLGQLKRAVLPG
eukprot:SAG22_NODE_6627_length_830_cov_0.805746_1_plen_103_part_01